MPYPRFTKIIINHFILQNKSISMRNRINLHTARNNNLLGTLKYVSKTEEHQVYGALIPKEMLNEDILNSTAYQTYYAYANGAKEPKKARKFKSLKPATKPKPTKKKASVKADRGKGDGTDFESGVPDEQQRKISGIDEGTGTKLGVPNVPKYDSKSEKESWGDSGEEEDDDEDDSEDESDDDNNDNDGDYNDNEDKNDDDDEVDSDRTESDIKEKDDAEELYRDVNVNLRKEDVEITKANQGGADQHNVSQELGVGARKKIDVMDFTIKLLTLIKLPYYNVIASLMDTTIRHEEPSSQTSSLFTILVMVIPEITSAFTTTIPPPPPSFNPLPKQATPTPTPTTSEH
ncbi:hypothetical protein Tco_1283987 [Tanacetum coccineum]